MRIIKHDEKKGFVVLLVETTDDLWWISQIVEKKDVVKAWTLRTIKKGKSEEKRRVFLAIEVEKATFMPQNSSFRITGPIIETSNEEDVQLGKYHSIDVSPGTRIEIWKKKGLALLFNIIKKAQKWKGGRIRVLLVDDERAKYYEVSSFDIKELWEIRKHRTKEKEEAREVFFKEIYDAINKEASFLIGGPGFEKEALADYLKQKGRAQFKLVSCQDVEISGIRYLIRTGILAKEGKALMQEEEARIWETFLMHLGKEDGLAVYGWKEVEKALSYGAVEHLLILLNLLKENESIRKTVEEYGQGCSIHLIVERSEVGEGLKSFGGICAILRFKI